MSALQQYGIQPLFGPKAAHYDIEAFKNKCYNIISSVYFCGQKNNMLLSPNRTEIIDRGAETLLYFP